MRGVRRIAARTHRPGYSGGHAVDLLEPDDPRSASAMRAADQARAAGQLHPDRVAAGSPMPASSRNDPSGRRETSATTSAASSSATASTIEATIRGRSRSATSARLTARTRSMAWSRVAPLVVEPGRAEGRGQRMDDHLGEGDLRPVRSAARACPRSSRRRAAPRRGRPGPRPRSGRRRGPPGSRGRRGRRGRTGSAASRPRGR